MDRSIQRIFKKLLISYPFLNSSNGSGFDDPQFFSGTIDEFMLFNKVLSSEQIHHLAGQILVHPYKQILSSLLSDNSIDALLVLLQFEEWQGVTTGTVGSAQFYSASGALRINDKSRSPLFINDGPLCYPKIDIPVGSRMCKAMSV